eukprot:CAMPEP_0176499146 /NCGR_PEP_ID=MMETSP0200_2-20121128/12749_1 /TAXON_ID=947934 /ORGANISM="Chaetoceros sp., Strain GSL56" /LENGTH=951 /DNA_ID=CAMNT_0017897501 /DNA_START=104 /DNA_END=2956 /DNA_ORIENTATION=+
MTDYTMSSSIQSDSRGGAGGGLLGQQLLVNAGIDTESLFRRARHLGGGGGGGGGGGMGLGTAAAAATAGMTGASSFHTTATTAPDKRTATATATSNTTTTSTTTSASAASDLQSFLQQSQSTFFQTTIDRQAQNIQSILDSKIQARLQKNFYNTLASLGHSQVIQRIRVPVATVSPFDEEYEGGGYEYATAGGGGDGDVGTIPFQSCISPTTDLLHSHNLSPLLQQHLEYFHVDTTGVGVGVGAGVGGGVNFKALLQFAQEGMRNEPYSNMISFLSCTLSSSYSSSSSTASSSMSMQVYRNCMVALEFLSQQYKSYIVHSVKNSPSFGGGLEMGRGGMRGYIEKYVQLEMGDVSLMRQHGGGMETASLSSSLSSWVGAYHALRCGDLDCVLEILMHAKDGVESCVVGLLQEICSLRQSGGGKQEEGDGMKRLWCSGMIGGNNVEKKEMILGRRREVRALYARLDPGRNVGGGGGSGGGIEYKLAVLALLSFTPLTECCHHVQKTSEDYVFMELWKGMGDSVEECREAVCDLADNIKHYGAEYFEDGVDESYNLWIYAMLLFFCQQVRSGLNYLAGKSHDGFCVAVHLALALVKQGIALTDLVREDNMTTAITAATTTTMTTLQQQHKNDKSKEYLAMLVSTFARGLQNSSPPLALNYLIQIPGTIQSGIDTKSGIILSKTALDKICRLLLDTRAYQSLGGTLAADGSRLANGALDSYFQKGAVSNILYHAAEYSIKEGKLADAAELLSLAGRYSDLLSLLNRRLSSLLVVTDDVHERMFWRQASEQFLKRYLSKGQMHVIQVLEKERQLPLGNTFQMLLNLMEFFDRCEDGKWESAWELIDHLDVIPKMQQDIPPKIESFTSQSLSIQNVFHHILSKAMQSLYQQYCQLKQSNVGTKAMTTQQQITTGTLTLSVVEGTVEQKLQQLKHRARVLTTFAGLIPLHCDDTFKVE